MLSYSVKNIIHRDALCDLVSIVQFKKSEKTPMEECYFYVTKSNTPPWAFFMFLKLYKWYQIAQSIAYLFGRTTITATLIQSRKLFIKFISLGNNIEYVDFDWKWII